MARISAFILCLACIILSAGAFVIKTITDIASIFYSLSCVSFFWRYRFLLLLFWGFWICVSNILVLSFICFWRFNFYAWISRHFKSILYFLIIVIVCSKAIWIFTGKLWCNKSSFLIGKIISHEISNNAGSKWKLTWPSFNRKKL